MRSSIFVLAASSCLASATWSNGRDLGVGIPSPARETGASNARVDATGWTPRPTEPPGREAVMELLKRRRGLGRRQDTNTWINDRTCGWFSESSSVPFTCDSDYTCATNQRNVVGCVSGTSSPFYTACLDYEAFEQNACASIGTATGCCTESSWGACGTFLWPGMPQKSMYRCFPEQTIISMLDQPREVLDSLTRSTTSSTTSSKPDTTTTSSSTGTGTNSPNTSTNSSSSSNIGAIVGGVVGGVAALAFIAGLIAYLIIRRKGKYSAVAPADPAPYPGPGPQPAPAPQYPSQSPPQMAMAPGGGGQFQPSSAGGTYPPSSPYQQSISTMTTAYDPHQSYYEAPKPPGHVSPGQQFSAYPAPYGQAPPLASPPQQFQPQLGPTAELESSMAGHHQGHMSELDSNAMQVGHQYNPAEMGVMTPRPQ